MPTIFHRMRESGNRIINPLDPYLPSETFEDYYNDPFVLDLVMNTLALPRTCVWFFPPSQANGMDLFQYLDNQYNQAAQAWWTRDVQTLLLVMDEVIEVFGRTGKILHKVMGCGFSPELWDAILTSATRFLPLCALVDVECAFKIIRALYEMTDKGDVTLMRLIGSMPLQDQAGLLLFVRSLQPGFLTHNIEAAIMGGPFAYR